MTLRAPSSTRTDTRFPYPTLVRAFRRAGIPMRLRAETNLSGTICDLVRLGHGVAILNGLSWAGGSQDALQVRPLTPHLANRYGVLRLADRAFSRPELGRASCREIRFQVV